MVESEEEDKKGQELAKIKMFGGGDGQSYLHFILFIYLWLKVKDYYIKHF